MKLHTAILLLVCHFYTKKIFNAKLSFYNNLTFTLNPSFYMTENMKGRKKQDFERIIDKQYRNIAFSKKKLGLFSKAEAFAKYEYFKMHNCRGNERGTFYLLHLLINARYAFNSLINSTNI